MLAWLDTLIAWTSVHLKAPTQVTCAHCQRSFSPELQALGFRSNPATFRPGEPHILHPFSLPSTPQFVFFSNRAANFYHRENFNLRRLLPASPLLRFRLSEGARIITPVYRSSTPAARLFFNRRTANQLHYSPLLQSSPSAISFRLSEGARTLTPLFRLASTQSEKSSARCRAPPLT